MNILEKNFMGCILGGMLSGIIAPGVFLLGASGGVYRPLKNGVQGGPTHKNKKNPVLRINILIKPSKLAIFRPFLRFLSYFS